MRLRVGQWFALASAITGTIAVVGITFGVIALRDLADARSRLTVDVTPALIAFERGARVLVEQDGALRLAAATGDPAELRAYRAARREADDISRELAPLMRREALAPARAGSLRVLEASQAWERTYARPTIAAIERGDRSVATPDAVAAGRARFAAVRRELDATLATLVARRVQARREIVDAADRVNVVFAVFGTLLLLSGLLAFVLIRQTVSVPIARLARQAREVAAGAFDQPVAVSGPRDVQELGRDVDQMRREIVAQLDASETTQRELERSNAELEQFAYVASHDLQEPLRKVASFTQLLERRYKGQLDERADQYIGFAVDGAKRMQVLINDLLAFSRVGRVREGFGDVALDDALAAALANLQSALEERGATVEAEPLPIVRGEAALLTAVFQNLVGNGVKFGREGVAPVVRVGCRRDGDVYEITVADNGIGIDPEYAERIFIIFQRLHAKEDYAGTGIGLALCRKIVEHHGGHIWLDTSTDGTTFRFTLPVPGTRPESAAAAAEKEHA